MSMRDSRYEGPRWGKPSDQAQGLRLKGSVPVLAMPRNVSHFLRRGWPLKRSEAYIAV